jgi:transcription elongation factor GreA
MIPEIKKLLEDRDPAGLETAWMSMLESAQAPLEQYFEIAAELKKIQETERAFTLLDILAGQLFDAGALREAIAVYKNMAYYTNRDAEIRKKLTRAYRRLHEKSEHLDEYIELSGLEKEGHLFKSLEKLDDFLKYDIGNVFYFEKYGLGEVVNIFPAKREAVIDFEKQKKYFVKFDVAKGLLTPIPADHFLYWKYRRLDELKKMAKNDESGTVKFLLSGINEPLTSARIKSYLSGIAGADEIEKLWDKARKKLERDDSIKIAGKAQKTYQFVKGGVDRTGDALKAFDEALPGKKYEIAEACAKDRDVFAGILPRLVEFANSIAQKEPAIALDLFFLCRSRGCAEQLAFGPDTLLADLKPEDIILELQGIEGKRQLLAVIKERNPDIWVKAFKSIFMRAGDPALLNEIEAHLASFPDELRDINQAILLLPHEYAQQYQWLLKRLARVEYGEFLAPVYVIKIVESLDKVKGIRSLVAKLLSLDRFDKIMKTAGAEDAERIRNAVQNSEVLADYERKDYLKIIEYHFPQLFKKEDTAVYVTEASLKKKQQELERLLSVEIPENKKEIGRARGFGDLSENFEYKAAKERQDQLYQKVRELESALQSAKVIDLAAADTSRVSIGTRVLLENKGSGATVEYTVLGRWDTDLEKNVISNESPLARDILLGHACGDRVEIGGVVYEIVKITRLVGSG